MTHRRNYSVIDPIQEKLPENHIGFNTAQDVIRDVSNKRVSIHRVRSNRNERVTTAIKELL